MLMDVNELIRRVRRIELKIRRQTREVFAGSYHSAFKGRGMSFSEVRRYAFGDDVRAIDWNVTARTGEPHIKVFEEERQLSLLLIADISASMRTGAEAKSDWLTELCATLAFSAEANHDKTGLLLFDDKPGLYLPPRKGRNQTLRIVRELLHGAALSHARHTGLAEALQYAHRVLRQRSVCVIVSDFIGDDFTPALRALSRRHDCIGIHLWDRLERELPDVGLARVRDAERGRDLWIDTTEPETRREWTRQFDARMATLHRIFAGAKADWVSVETGKDFLPTLLGLFDRRRQRFS